MQRRKFLESFGALGLSLTFQGISLANQDCTPPPPEPDDSGESINDIYKRLYNVPEHLQRLVYQGYLPRKILDGGSFLTHIRTALFMHDVLSDKRYFTIIEKSLKIYCDETYSYSMETVDAPPEYSPEIEELMKVISRAIKDPDLQQNEIFAANFAINTLIASLRDLDYIAHEDFLGIPKTLLQLLKDKSGDCKDFALSRYMLARAFGIKDEHLMIVIYTSATSPGTGGHANLAIYHPATKSWFTIDGTGREPATQEAGLTIVFENSDATRNHYNHLVPTLGITNQGVFEFDSVKNIKPSPEGITYDVLPRKEIFPYKKDPVAFIHDPIPKKNKAPEPSP